MPMPLDEARGRTTALLQSDTRLTDTDMQLAYFTPDDFFRRAGIEKDEKITVEKLLFLLPEYAPSPLKVEATLQAFISSVFKFWQDGVVPEKHIWEQGRMALGKCHHYFQTQNADLFDAKKFEEGIYSRVVHIVASDVAWKWGRPTWVEEKGFQALRQQCDELTDYDEAVARLNGCVRDLYNPRLQDYAEQQNLCEICAEPLEKMAEILREVLQYSLVVGRLFEKAAGHRR